MSWIERIHDKDDVLNAYVGTDITCLEIWNTNKSYIFRARLWYEGEVKIFTCDIDLDRFNMAVLMEAIESAIVLLETDKKGK